MDSFLYDNGLRHERVENILPSFRSILSSIGTPNYKLAKFLVFSLSDVTQNEFTVEDSFTFVNET